MSEGPTPLRCAFAVHRYSLAAIFSAFRCCGTPPIFVKNRLRDGTSCPSLASTNGLHGLDGLTVLGARAPSRCGPSLTLGQTAPTCARQAGSHRHLHNPFGLGQSALRTDLPDRGRGRGTIVPPDCGTGAGAPLANAHTWPAPPIRTAWPGGQSVAPAEGPTRRFACLRAGALRIPSPGDPGSLGLAGGLPGRADLPPGTLYVSHTPAADSGSTDHLCGCDWPVCWR